jgi:hypothetical protein
MSRAMSVVCACTIIVALFFISDYLLWPSQEQIDSVKHVRVPCMHCCATPECHKSLPAYAPSTEDIRDKLRKIMEDSK